MDDAIWLECLSVFPNCIFYSCDSWVTNGAAATRSYPNSRRALNAEIAALRTMDADSLCALVNNDGALGVPFDRAKAFLASIGADVSRLEYWGD